MIKFQIPNIKRKIVIICGGPSAERGISLNSARSLFDNFDKNKYHLNLIYVNPGRQFFEISPLEIYSNTPLDFDFKLRKRVPLSKKKLRNLLKKADTVFPVIHGIFGEDGQLQTMLEKIGAHYVGSGPESCQNTANKYFCQEILKKHGFYTVPNYLAEKGRPPPKLPPGSYVAKPLHGGSSIGVQHIKNTGELAPKLKKVFQIEKQAIIEPYCNGKEFTVIVLQNKKMEPVALIPTEIELNEGRFFDYRKKYLATAQTRYHTPPRFSELIIKQIQRQAEHAFSVLGMRDFGRLDGWVLKDGSTCETKPPVGSRGSRLEAYEGEGGSETCRGVPGGNRRLPPGKDGTIWFSDINAISGMEQNSFLFQQAALLGISHSQLLDYIFDKDIDKIQKSPKSGEEIPVIFGGNTAERQVSIMSGTNVWIKLKSSSKYKPVPIFLDRNGKMHHIPQFLCLQHTVEEIEEKIKLFKNHEYIKTLHELQKKILKKLDIHKKNLEEDLFEPRQISLQAIARKYKFLFLGLHGGKGENGTMQTLLDELRLPYNGPGANSSKLCMDKFLTGEKIKNARIPGVFTAKKMLFSLKENPKNIWKTIQKNHFPPMLVIKPRSDGCSAGVITIKNFEEFKKTISFFTGNKPYIPAKAIHPFHGQIDLPHDKLDEILVEELIKTDQIKLKNLQIRWREKTDFIEITTGILGHSKNMIVTLPGQTIAGLETLSMEEKFMGGTGINLVPPPAPFVKPAVIKKVQERLKKVAKILGIEGYARIDCFMNRKNGDIIVIEANTLPALTPSTIFFQQALRLKKPLAPKELIEKIIELGKQRFISK